MAWTEHTDDADAADQHGYDFEFRKIRRMEVDDAIIPYLKIFRIS